MSELEVQEPLWKTVDAITRARCGNLAAYGLIETQIADAVLIKVEQVIACKESPEYIQAYAKATSEKTQRAIDLEDGWDAVEEAAVHAVLQGLQYNRDPAFALSAARVANQATRRTPGSNRAPINAAKAGTVIVLQMNKTFVDKSMKGNGAAMIDVSPQEKNKSIEQRRVDMATPDQVNNLLNIARQTADDMRLGALEKAMKLAGINLMESAE